jgi:hypothetical protein
MTYKPFKQIRQELADRDAKARESLETANWLTLTPALAVKIGSLIVHTDEYLSPGGHEYDGVAIKDLLSQDDVQAWLKSFPLAMLPVKRS